MKRSEPSAPQRGISTSLRLAFLTGTFEELPKGYKKSQVLATLPVEELHSLQRSAEYEASGFETLNQRDVEELNDVSMILGDRGICADYSDRSWKC